MVEKMVEFDEQAAKALEAGYLSPDVAAQRAVVLERLALRNGEIVLDIGSGPGLLVAEMAKLVGDEGQVTGLDMSAPMNVMAAARCKDFASVDFKEGDATNLPFKNASFDVVVSTQVYEYVPDMPLALSELHRVLKPGGRVLILDTDWDSLAVNVSDRNRHHRIIKAWDEHLADPNLPAKLIPLLTNANFVVTSREAHPLLNTEYQANTYSSMIIPFIRNFVIGRQGIAEDEANAWMTDLKELGQEGAFFFSLNRYMFRALKPG